jgi:hypothetical protein
VIDSDEEGDGLLKSASDGTSVVKQSAPKPKPKAVAAAKSPQKKQPAKSKAVPQGGGKGQVVEQNVEKIAEPGLFDWLGPFLNSDRMESDLGLLQTSPDWHLSDDFFAHYLELLQRLRYGQGVMYKAATKFKEYYDQQASALSTYSVRSEVQFDSSKKDQFIKSMNTTLKASYSNAFTRNELVVICCLLASPGLTFTNIDQKTRVSQKSGMIRGMSFVPESLERFFHQRLRKLQVIDDVNHPKCMEPLSTVVLNSTYCYKQIFSWGRGADFLSVRAEPITLIGFPEFLSVNGVYVRVRSHDTTRLLYAQVMSKKAAGLLGIPQEVVYPHKDQARVLSFPLSESKESSVCVRVQCFISKGLGEPTDPICVATFNIKAGPGPEQGVEQRDLISNMFSRLGGVGQRVLTSKMFSHLGQDGQALYQDIPGSQPSVRLLTGVFSNDGVGLEYGPDLIPRCVVPEHNFKPAPLNEQAGHVDGNFYHAKGQWAEVTKGNEACKGMAGSKRPGHGLFRAAPHVPLVRESEMENTNLIEPLYLQGDPHMNSLSFLMNVNGKTTLTFPAKDQAGASGARRAGNDVEAVPYGGLSAFGFIRDHMGSLYGLLPNERPHLYAHSGDLRQFPVQGFDSLFTILAAKQRVEQIRGYLRDPSISGIQVQRFQQQETALKHFIFSILATSTYKTSSQAVILKQVQDAALQSGMSGSGGSKRARTR